MQGEIQNIAASDKLEGDKQVIKTVSPQQPISEE